MASSVDLDQTKGAVCSGSTLFASIVNLSAMLGNYLQLKIEAYDIFRCIFSWHFKGLHCYWKRLFVIRSKSDCPI